MAEQRANSNSIIVTDFDADRVSEWEAGLPDADDVTPLSQPLIPPELASAFSIAPEPQRSNLDVNRASQSTLSAIIGGSFPANCSANFKPFVSDQQEEDGGGGEDSARKIRRVEPAEENNSNNGNNNNNNNGKRARLVWTPQLHKRFVEVVARLGIKSAVPKTIMQMMNVEGLTRENVASHLQKYRLYLKRMQGLSNDSPTASDHLFASTPVPNTLRESTTHNNTNNTNTCGGGDVMMSSMPVYGVMGQSYSGFDYNVMMRQHQQPRDWGSGGKFGSVNSYQHHRISPGGHN